MAKLIMNIIETKRCYMFVHFHRILLISYTQVCRQFYFQTILVLPYLKKKEKNMYTLRKTGINYANKQEKKRICDDVPKLNCAKGLGKGVGVQILFSLFPRGILDFLFR